MDETIRQLGELLLGSIPTIIVFILLWIAYRLIVHGALGRALAERRSRTVGAVEKARTDIAAAESKTAEYEQKIRDARLAVYKGQESRRQQILEQKMTAIAEARQVAEAKVNSTRAEILRDIESAKTKVQAESSSLAAEIVRAILRTGTSVREPAIGGRG